MSKLTKFEKKNYKKKLKSRYIFKGLNFSIKTKYLIVYRGDWVQLCQGTVGTVVKSAKLY